MRSTLLCLTSEGLRVVGCGMPSELQFGVGQERKGMFYDLNVPMLRSAVERQKTVLLSQLYDCKLMSQNHFHGF